MARHPEPEELRVICGTLNEETHYVVAEPDDFHIFYRTALEHWSDVKVYRLVEDDDGS